MRDAGPTEIGGFGVSDADDLLLVRDIVLVKQQCSSVTVAFDDAAVAGYFDARVDEGLAPAQFGRIWFHTHPGTSPHPSGVDEETFARVFGPSDWAVMAILARGGAWYARLRANVGPGVVQQIPVKVAWDEPFVASDRAAWLAEYEACVSTGMEWYEGQHDTFIDPDEQWGAELADVWQRHEEDCGRARTEQAFSDYTQAEDPAGLEERADPEHQGFLDRRPAESYAGIYEDEDVYDALQLMWRAAEPWGQP